MIELPNTKTFDNNHKSFYFSKQSHVNLYGLPMFILKQPKAYGYPYLSTYCRTIRKHSYLLSHNASPCKRDCRLEEKVRSIKKAGNARFFLSREN
jgi:hypothetical protein